jgi:hypothetical protein
MTRPMLHLRNLEGDPIHAECTACPYPEVSFEVGRKHSPEEVIAELLRQFEEHCKRVHEVGND